MSVASTVGRTPLTSDPQRSNRRPPLDPSASRTPAKRVTMAMAASQLRAKGRSAWTPMVKYSAAPPEYSLPMFRTASNDRHATRPQTAIAATVVSAVMSTWPRGICEDRRWSGRGSRHRGDDYVGPGYRPAILERRVKITCGLEALSWIASRRPLDDADVAVWQVGSRIAKMTTRALRVCQDQIGERVALDGEPTRHQVVEEHAQRVEVALNRRSSTREHFRSQIERRAVPPAGRMGRSGTRRRRSPSG